MTLAIHDPRSLATQDNPMTIALATYSDKNQIAVIRDQICVGATPSEMWVFLARCVALGLDPFSRQIYFIKRDSKNGPVVAHQIGIDGFRSVAARTDQLVGISEPEFEGEVECKGQRVPALARVIVTKEIRGKDRDFVGTARWTEFYPGDVLGFMWQKMPYHMLSKCAEAQAFRRAFPQQLGGLQTDAEAMGYEGLMAAADSARFQPAAPQYVEVTDTTTGEMKTVRAGDEYVRLMQERGEDVQVDTAPVRRQAHHDRAAYANGDAVARRASESLSEVIEAHPEPPHDDDDAQAMGQVDSSEGLVWDYGLCKEIYDANPDLTLDRPLPRLKPADYAAWHAKYVQALEAAGSLPF